MFRIKRHDRDVSRSGRAGDRGDAAAGATARRRSRVPARLAAVVAVGATVLSLTAAPAHASWHAANVGGSGVNVRDCYHPTKPPWPGTSCRLQATLAPGTAVHVVCQYVGELVNGDTIWDYIVYPGGEGYAADYYIDTHTTWYRMPWVDECDY